MKEKTNNKSWGIFYKSIALSSLVFSGGYFYSYFSKPKILEMDLLKSTAEYVQEYKGNPKEVLDYAKRTLQFIAQRNTGVKEISDLEKELSWVSQEGVNKGYLNVYTMKIYTDGKIPKTEVTKESALKYIGEKMENVADKNRRNPFDAYLGILLGLWFLAWLFSCKKINLKKQKN